MEERFNRDMLILAREARGLTQTALAKACGISQATISKYEAGVLDVSDEHVDVLSSALEVRPGFFFQQETRYGFGSACFYHRKRQSMPIQELRTIQAQLNMIRIQVGVLLRGAEVEADNSFFRMDVVEYGPPERIAQEVRTAWRLPLGPIADLVGAIERAGGLVFKCPFGTDKLDAVSQWVPGSPPLFFLNAESQPDRARFTLAHELGHVVMHQVPTEDREREADRFAAEFLMPEREIASQLRPLGMAKLATLKAYWRVSMAALIRRAFTLEKLSERQYRRLYTELSAIGGRKREPVEIQKEEPTVIRDIVRVHLDDHLYSAGQLSEVLKIYEPEFRRSYLPYDSPLRVHVG